MEFELKALRESEREYDEKIADMNKQQHGTDERVISCRVASV